MADIVVNWSYGQVVVKGSSIDPHWSYGELYQYLVYTLAQIGGVGKLYTLLKAPRPVMRAVNGDIYAVLLNTTDNRLEMWKSVDNGVNWTNPGTNQTALGSGGAYDAHIDGADPQIIHVVYYYSATAVYYNTFNISTGEWGAGVSLATVASTTSRGCSIACDSSNVPHVSFVDYPSSVVTLIYRNKTGGSWQAAVTVDNTALPCLPNIAVDTTNAPGHRYDVPQIAYIRSGGSAPIYAALGNANNATSFTLVRPAAQATSGYYPSIIIDVNGKTNIASIYNSAAAYQQCVSIPGASAWGTAGNWTNEADIFGNDSVLNASSLIINGTTRYVFGEQTTLHDIRKIASMAYGAWGGAAYLEVGTYQDVRARWQYANNPSYETYGIDFLFATANPGTVYWDRLIVAYDASLALTAAGGLAPTPQNVMDRTLALSAAGALSQVKTLTIEGTLALPVAGDMGFNKTVTLEQSLGLGGIAELTQGVIAEINASLALSGMAELSQESIQLVLKAIGVLLDEALVMEPSPKTYNLRVRRRDDSMLLNLLTIAGESNAVYFEVPIHPDGELPGIGDLAMFGETARETAELIVKNIERGLDLSAKLYLVDAAPEIHDADQGIIPPFDSLISIPAAWYVPEVYTVQSDSTVGARNSDGSWSPRIVIALTRPASWLQADIIQVEALFRPANTQGPWASVSALSADMAVILTPVFEGVQYEFRLRYVKADGSKGNWGELHYHTVEGGPESLPDITNLVAVYRDGRTALVWDTVQDVDNPVISYEVRKGDAWGSAEIMGQVKDTLYVLPGDGKYWVAAVAGLVYSANPVYLLMVGTIINQNVVAEFDEQATGWTGTLTDCYVDGSDFLQLDVVDGEVVESGSYEIPAGHIVDVGEPMPCVVSVAYAALGSNINATVDDILDWDEVSDVDGNYAGFYGVKAQMQLAQADGVFGAWQDFAPGTYVARKFNFQLLLTSLDVEVTPIIQSFTFLVDMPDRMESDNDLGIADTGASIAFTRAFQVPPNVQITIIDAQDGDYCELSNITTTGFDLIVKNGGVGVHRHINWLAKGY